MRPLDAPCALQVPRPHRPLGATTVGSGVGGLGWSVTGAHCPGSVLRVPCSWTPRVRLAGQLATLLPISV